MTIDQCQLKLDMVVEYRRKLSMALVELEKMPGEAFQIKSCRKELRRTRQQSNNIKIQMKKKDKDLFLKVKHYCQ